MGGKAGTDSEESDLRDEKSINKALHARGRPNPTLSKP